MSEQKKKDEQNKALRIMSDILVILAGEKKRLIFNK